MYFLLIRLQKGKLNVENSYYYSNDNYFNSIIQWH